MHRPLLILTTICLSIALHAQDNNSTIDKIAGFPTHFIERTKQKAAILEAKLERQTVHYLEKLEREEARLKRKLATKDSSMANNLLNAEALYPSLISKIKSASTASGKMQGEYLPFADSLKGALIFLQQNNQLLTSSKELQDQLNSSVTEVKELQNKLQDADEIKAFIRQRKEQISTVLNRYTDLPNSISKTFQNYNLQLYYYAETIREYKNTLNDPDRLEKEAVTLLSKLPAFQKFMKENGQLGTLFGVPASYASQSVNGLQTRDQVQQLIQSQLSASGPNAPAIFQQNQQAAQQQLNTLKDKINKLGAGSSDIEIPKESINSQKTKSFLKRIEIGTDLQTQHANYFYPNLTDFGLSIGYRLTDKSVLGVGTSAKIGWGQDIQHIQVSASGLSIRSFFDLHIKSTFYGSAAFEYNYVQTVTAARQIESLRYWNPSGLVGMSKIISVKSRLFKKTKVSLLWDYLSYYQVPQGQALKFRVGYNF